MDISPTRPSINAIDSASIFIRPLEAAPLAGDCKRFAQRARTQQTADPDSSIQPLSRNHSASHKA
jgi:hypothetical protein